MKGDEWTGSDNRFRSAALEVTTALAVAAWRRRGGRGVLHARRTHTDTNWLASLRADDAALVKDLRGDHERHCHHHHPTIMTAARRRLMPVPCECQSASTQTHQNTLLPAATPLFCPLHTPPFIAHLAAPVSSSSSISSCLLATPPIFPSLLRKNGVRRVPNTHTYNTHTHIHIHTHTATHTHTTHTMTPICPARPCVYLSPLHRIQLGRQPDALLDLDHLPIGGTVIPLHPPLPLVGVSIGMDGERQQNDSLADGYDYRPCDVAKRVWEGQARGGGVTCSDRPGVLRGCCFDLDQPQLSVQVLMSHTHRQAACRHHATRRQR